MSSLKLSNISDVVRGKISLSGSKSISNRVMFIRRLANNAFNIENLSKSDDTTKLSALLEMICKCGDSNIPMVIDTADAGTVSRFLTAFLSFREGTWLVTGTRRMQERPVEGLVNGLVDLGADITFAEKNGRMPLRIVGTDIRGGEIVLDASQSSQFVSALLLISPYFEEGLKIIFKNPPVSWPYIEMTTQIMEIFGVKVDLNEKRAIVKHASYKPLNFTVEGDWSSAAYWYETIALAEGGKIILENLDTESIQGDSVLIEIYRNFGVETKKIEGGIELSKSGKIVDEFEYDFKGCPDLVPPVMTTCAAFNIPSVYKNIDHLSFKESDRIEALKSELSKIGAFLEHSNNEWILTPGNISHENEIIFSTYNDHRIAMCLAPLILKFDNITIENANVVNKSYPDFWKDFLNLKFASLKIISDN